MLTKEDLQNILTILTRVQFTGVTEARAAVILEQHTKKALAAESSAEVAEDE